MIPLGNLSGIIRFSRGSVFEVWDGAGFMKSFFYALLLTFASVSLVQSETPFDSAVGVWHFADDLNSADPNSHLVLNGPVKLGVRLSEKEVADSQIRGGDGIAADFSNGGWIDAGIGSDAALAVKGRELTCYLRVRFAKDQIFPTPVFSRHGGADVLAYNIYAFDEYLGAEVGTTVNKRNLAGYAPWSDMRFPETAREDWHDLVLRVNGAKLEWFADGRCFDEDFMLGELRQNSLPLLFGAEMRSEGEIADGFRGEIDTAALWNRALSDEEILFLSGGTERADLRERTDRGNDETLQYWMPPNRYSVGDCMPYYADGLFHFMYLLDKGHHSAKNGLGAHQWIQATSADLVHWEHQPFTVEIEKQEEGSICTGSVFYYDGLYYAFYANRAFRLPDQPDGKIEMFGRLALSVSHDGIHFEKKKEPLFLLPEGYAPTARDPVVFRDEKTGLFHIYLTCSYRGNGCWAHAVSENLTDWELQDPVYTYLSGEPECPDWFEWGGKYYTFANHGNGYWRWSDSPTGPWDLPDGPNQIMPGIINVPKSAPFGNDRRIVCGWTREHGFGGHAVFHELVRRDDGTLGEKFVPEMIPATGECAVSEKDVAGSEKSWKVPFGNLRLRFCLEFSPEMRDSLRDMILIYDSERKLVISPRSRSAALGDFRIDRLDFSTGRLEFDLIIKGDLIDMELNHDRTLTGTVSEAAERTISLISDGPGWKVVSVEIAPLK